MDVVNLSAQHSRVFKTTITKDFPCTELPHSVTPDHFGEAGIK